MDEPEARRSPNGTARILWLNLAGVAAVFLLLYALYAFRSVLTAFFVAALLAYLLDPLVDRMERRGIPRWIGILLLLLVVLVLAAGASVFVFPLIQAEAVSLMERFPGYVERVRGWIAPLVARVTGMAPSEVGLSVDTLAARLKSLPPDLWRWLSRLVWQTTSGILSAALVLINLAIIPVAMFYLLRDFDALKERALGHIPPKHREYWVGRFVRMDELLGCFVKGQLLVGLVLAVVYSAGLLVVGTPLGILIGLLAGLANVVPYLGLVVGLLPALGMTFLEFGGGPQLLGVLAVFAVGQALEGFVLTPRIVGDRVGLHPVVVMMAVLIGGAGFGFLGVL
ncbi:MAG: AI-2E family transporter, partial [Nitrospinota bacterium]